MLGKVILDPITKRFIDTGESMHSGINNPFYGKHHTNEVRARLRSINLGKQPSSETRLKMSIALSGENNPMYGKYHSQESKEKNRLSNLGKHHHSKELREKMSFKGENHPMFGKHQTKEAKDKMSASAKLRWQKEEYFSKQRETRNTKPNKSELRLQSVLNEYFPNTYKYVGDYQICIGGRFPDFINVNGEKEVIELFGIFYHKPDETESLINHYKQYGFSCIIIWDAELENKEALIKHIKEKSIYIPYGSVSTIFDSKEEKPIKVIIFNTLTKKFSQV